jgi:hypothetical protein
LLRSSKEAFSGGVRLGEHDRNQQHKQAFQTIVSTCMWGGRKRND